MAKLHQQMQELIGQDDLLADRYRIGRRIGAGAYGMIFHAVDEDTGESVAIKAIPPQAGQQSATAVARFQREMKVIRNLEHPNIITLHDWGRTDTGLVFMVLEFIEGQTLDDVVRDDPMDADVAIDTTRQLAAALYSAHKEGVIHRDLKPANVMLTPRSEGKYVVKVLDFGMAKVLSPLGDESSVMDLTSEGMAVGTPRYIAPEQARGLEVGPATDLYAVGLLMYEMFTGVKAVDADNVKEAVTAHVSEQPLELKKIDKVPPFVRPVLQRLVEKDAELRVQSGRQLDELLQKARAVDRRRESSGSKHGGSRSAEQFHQSSAVNPLDPSALDLELELGGDEPLNNTKSSDGIERGLRSSSEEAARRQAMRDRWFRPPRTPGEWFEGAISMAFIPVAMMAVGAQAGSWDFAARSLLSFSPALVALALALLRDSADWGESFGRLCWMCCAVAIVIAHLLGPQQMATSLLLDPVWILEPLDGVPAVGVLESVMRWVSSQWAELVFWFVGGGS